MAQVFRTRFTELVGVEHPVMQGGMMWVSQPQLVAAVANAGGLGVLTALTFETPDRLREAIVETRRLTDRPFGVNVTFLPTLVPKDYGALMRVIVEERVPIIETAGRNPEPYMELLTSGGAKVIHKCTSVRFAQKAESIGCDVVSIDGFECAGHPGEEDVTSLLLIPLTVDAVSIPVIASGGFADGRGLAAALALGADGINMGTRFLVTDEAPVHQAVKEWLVESRENETALVLRTLNNTERVMRNPIAQRVIELEAGGAGIEQLAPLVSGRRGLKVMEDGAVNEGLLAAGQAVGLINDIPSVAELIDCIVDQARGIVAERLPGLLV